MQQVELLAFAFCLLPAPFPQSTSGFTIESSRMLLTQRTFLPFSFAVAFGSIVGVIAAPAQAQSYTLTDLGLLGSSQNFGTQSSGIGVNDLGQVAGYSTTASSQNRAFLSGTNSGVLKDLGTLGGSQNYSFGLGLNDTGQVTGFSENASGSQDAFLSGPNGGPLKDLGGLTRGGGSRGLGVNASGQVTGYSANGNLGQDAFLSRPNGGTLKDLGTLGGINSQGNAVNAAGQVAGFSDLPQNSGGYAPTHAFLSGVNGGPLKDLGTLGGSESEGYAVNDLGQVTGFSENASLSYDAFVSGVNGGPLTDLGTLPGYDFRSVGTGINSAGQVIGESFKDDTDASSPIFSTHPFLYSNGVMTDLNSLIASGSGFTLYYADGISNTGFITGTGIDAAGVEHAFLLSPVPEASTTVSFSLLLALGGVMTLARHKKINTSP